MNIYLISQLNSIKSINNFQTKRHQLQGLQNDCFIRTTSFGQLNDGKSFADFDRWAKAQNFKFHARDIIDDPHNYYGSDYEGQIYKIPDCDRWIIKKHLNENIMPMQVKETTYTEVDDVSPTINIGQPIASLRIPLNSRITEHYYIHKTQNGGKLGLQLGLMKNVNSATAGKYIESLSQVQVLDSEAFDELVRDVRMISDMQYNFNGKEPNNLILNSDLKKINITGLNQTNSERKGQHTEVLYALLGGDFAEKFINSHRPDSEKAKAIKFSNVIAAKFLKFKLR